MPIPDQAPAIPDPPPGGPQAPLYVLIYQLSQKLEQVINHNEETRELLRAHMAGEEQLLSKFLNAFPDSDTESHRRYHEALMKQLEQRGKLRAAIIEKTTTGVIWLGVVWIASAVWENIKNNLK